MTRFDHGDDHGYGSYGGTDPQPALSASMSPPPDPVTSLERLEALHRSGAVTEVEFAAAKANILGIADPSAPVAEGPRTRLVFKILGWCVAVPALLLMGGVLLADLTQVTTALPTEPAEAQASADPVPNSEPVVDHEVRKREDVSFAAARRTVLRVQVPAGTTRSEIEDLSRHLVEQERANNPYDALALYFYDRFRDDASPLGWAEDAPHGDWARSAESDGAYTTHRLNLDNLREVDWSQQPSAVDYRAADLYAELGRQDVALHGEFTLEHDERTAAVAAELGITAEEADAAVNRVTNWSLGVATR